MPSLLTKAQVRREIRGRRRARTLPEGAGQDVCRIVVDAVALSAPQVVASYLSYGTEMPTRHLNEALAAAGYEVVVPRPGPDGLAQWTDLPDDPSTWTHIDPRLGPDGPALCEARAAAIGVCVVPALALDRRGMRLGQGGGWYDRALTALPHARIIGLTWDDDLLDVLPTEPHDIPVDLIATERGCRVPIRR